jgi:hypothetical protein
MTRLGPERQRVRMPYVEWLAERLSARDWAIIETLHMVRLAYGLQLERLHFHELTGKSRSVVRSSVLKRLLRLRVITSLDRRIGYALHGSTSLRYALDSAGEKLIRLRHGADLERSRVRRPRIPSERFVAHTLAVTELYVALAEKARIGGRFVLANFQAEGASYWPNGLGGWIKPDAFVKLRRGGATDFWWYEADLPRHDSDIANESLPTISGKLGVYLDFVQRGQLGPDGIVPRVVFGVPTARRQAAIEALIADLPAPAESLFRVAEMARVAQIMEGELTR